MTRQEIIRALARPINTAAFGALLLLSPSAVDRVVDRVVVVDQPCYLCGSLTVPHTGAYQPVGGSQTTCVLPGGCPFHFFGDGHDMWLSDEPCGWMVEPEGGSPEDGEEVDDDIILELEYSTTCVEEPLGGRHPKDVVISTWHCDQDHTECPNSSPSALQESEIVQLVATVTSGNPERLRKFLKVNRDAENIHLNTARSALQVSNCSGGMFAHISLSKLQVEVAASILQQ